MKRALKDLFNLSKREWFLLLGILLLAAAPRGIELLNHNYLFGFDQGEYFLSVKKIVVDRTPTLIGTVVGGERGFFQGPGWYYLLSIPFILSRGNPYGAMILMFLFGIGTVLFSFVFVRKMYGLTAAIFVSFLIAISPAIIPQSRFIWPPFPVSFLSVFTLYSIYKVLQKDKKYLALLTFSIGMMTHFETAIGATWFISLLPILPFMVVKKLISPKSMTMAIGALVLTQLPLAVFDLKHDFLNTRGVLATIFSSGGVKLPLNIVFENRWGVFKENFLTTFPYGESLWPIILGIGILGLLFSFKEKKNAFVGKSYLGYLVASPILLFLVFLKYGSFMWSWWILELNIIYCFLFGISFAYLLSKKYLKWVILSLVLFLLGAHLQQTYNWYLHDFNDFGGVHKIKGKEQAFDYIYKDAAGKPFNLLIFTPPIYTYGYDYLLWWYGRQKYGYVPGKEKKGTFYLLIEPDPFKPWTYKGWLETVIKTGKVIETKTLPSGFIVQKRHES